MYGSRHIALLLVLFSIINVSCAGILTVFRGNTRKEFGDYDILERQEYQQYLNEMAEQPRRADREALQRLTQENERARKSMGANKAPMQSRVIPDSSAVHPPSAEEKRPFIVRTLRRLFRIKD